MFACVCVFMPFLRLNAYIYVDIFVFLNKYVHTNAKLSVSRFRYLHIQQKKTRQARLKRALQSITTLYTDSFLIASLSICIELDFHSADSKEIIFMFLHF